MTPKKNQFEVTNGAAFGFSPAEEKHLQRLADAGHALTSGSRHLFAFRLELENGDVLVVQLERERKGQP